MKIKPLFDRVVLKPLESESETKGGIILPTAAQEKSQLAEVIAVGSGKNAEGKEVGMSVKVGDKVLYISVANNLSVDCDCVATPADPQMGDLGIFASLDPVALDRACIDAVRNSSDHGKIHLIERIDSKHGMHNLEYAEQLGLGSQKYELVELD